MFFARFDVQGNLNNFSIVNILTALQNLVKYVEKDSPKCELIDRIAEFERCRINLNKFFNIILATAISS